MPLIQTIQQMFSYNAILNAFIVGILVSVCAAVLGVSLVLRRYSMIGDGLSHVGYGAVAIALCFGAAPLKIAIPVVLVAAFFLLKLTENSKINSDSAIAMIASASLAAGIVVNHFSSASSADAQSYLFGSILLVTKSEMHAAVWMLSGILILYILVYPQIFAITFDENYYHATGGRTKWIQLLISAATAITVVLGLKIMGAMLISSLIVFPPLTAMQNAKSFRGVVLIAALASFCALIGGLFFSYFWDWPTGATIVLFHLALFLLSYFVSVIRRAVRKR